MTTVYSALRQIGERDTNAAQRLAYLGYTLQRDLHVPVGCYLRFDTRFADQAEMTGFIDIASWLTGAIPQLEGIDWFSIDRNILASLVPGHALQLEFINQHAPIEKTEIIELIDDADAIAGYPRIATTNGIVLVERFKYGQAGAEQESRLESMLTTVLEFVVGHSRIPLSALSEIEVGDLVLVSEVSEKVFSNNKALFQFSLQQGSAEIVEAIEGDERRNFKNEELSMSAEHKFDNLPIELSIVLMEKTVTLQELQAIVPGEAIALPENQVLDVEVRANGRSFCRGELVQLPDGQLAVEVRHISA